MKIAIGADHGAFLYKEEIKKHFKDIEFVDCGALQLNPEDDYTDFSFRVAELVASGQAEKGIMLCRTGVGAVIAMNKVEGIRAGVCESVESVTLARKKNNINCLSFGADNVKLKNGYKIIDKFINQEFEGGRHARRIEKIQKYEQERTK